MSNGKEIINELDFTQRIEAMPDRKLLEFVAGKVYETSLRCPIHNKRINALEKRDTKMFGVSGAIGGIISGFVVGLVSYFRGQ